MMAAPLQSRQRLNVIGGSRGSPIINMTLIKSGRLFQSHETHVISTPRSPEVSPADLTGDCIGWGFA
jgi:hypothetical protein